MRKDAKRLAAEKAITYLRDGMTIGLGTGSTASYAIDAIGKMVREGFSVNAVASSVQSEALAVRAGISLLSFAALQRIDLYLDGADEVDPLGNLIKGGGGALLREKILAFYSKEFIVIVDSSKLVNGLGKFPLPVEVVPFAYELTQKRLEGLGCSTSLRLLNQIPFITDNGNYIIDCRFSLITNVKEMNNELKSIPGVVESGLFLNTMVSKIIVGDDSGKTRVIDRHIDCP